MADWLAQEQRSRDHARSSGRPWLGVHYACAGTYGRVVLDRSGTCYQAVCPKCSQRCVIRVGAGGTSQRMFTVSCGVSG